MKNIHKIIESPVEIKDKCSWWYNTTTGETLRWNGTIWKEIDTSSYITDAYTKAESDNKFETIENVADLLDNKADAAITLEGYGIPDTPLDNKMYGRKNRNWEEITTSGGGITDAPSDDKIYGRQNGEWSEIVNSGGGGGITDAPSDNKTYGRLNATWSEIDTSSYITDAPADGFVYGRKAGVWEQIDTSVGGIINHNDISGRNDDLNFLHTTQAQQDRWTNNYTYKLGPQSVSNWVASIEYDNFYFQAQINIPNLTENDFVNVVFGVQ